MCLKERLYFHRGVSLIGRVWIDHRGNGDRHERRGQPIQVFIAVQAETYLLACQRYIELNPVRAAMVEAPAHYRWTSYRANGLGQPDARVTPHALYQALGRNDKQRQTNYRGLFRGQPDRAAIDDIRLALNQSQPLGNARFYAKIEQMTGQRREARPRGRPRVESKPAGTVLPGQMGLDLSNN